MAVKVVYIAGTGRNGSTLLGMLLHRLPGVTFVGELTHLWERGLEQNQLCGCRRPLLECEFWREVCRRAFGQVPPAELPQLIELRRRVSRLRGLAWLAAGQSHVDRLTVQEYGQVYRCLVEAIAAVSGDSTIVDSSKYPTDLAALRCAVPELPIYTLHLVRDCRAVAYSWKRRKERPEIHWTRALMPRYGVVRTAMAANVFFRLIARQGRQVPQRYCRLRYEDLVDAPEVTLRRVSEWLEHDAVMNVKEEIGEWGHRPELIHTVAGNPCRFAAPGKRIRLDDEWMTEMKPTERWIVEWLCNGVQRETGYAAGPTGRKVEVGHDLVAVDEANR
ncbi:MAG: sulfotransferase [Pirellulaceae bacterium]|nr:MAG: sulfotransferase [Pirellulaceae bacterium]